MEKETREQYAARRQRIEQARALRREIFDALRGSGYLGRPMTTQNLVGRRGNLAAEGDYRMASVVNETIRLRRALVRKDKLIRDLAAEMPEARIRRAHEHGLIRGLRAGLSQTREGVKQERINRKLRRAAAKTERGARAAERDG